MKIGITLIGVEKLERKLKTLNALRFDGVVKKNTVNLFNYMKSSGHTPVDTGELRNSLESIGKNDKDKWIKRDAADFRNVVDSNGGGVVGYKSEYAPHVEYGHRTVGGWVPGQYYLKNGVDHQREIYRQDLIDAIKKEGG